MKKNRGNYANKGLNAFTKPKTVVSLWMHILLMAHNMHYS